MILNFKHLTPNFCVFVQPAEGFNPGQDCVSGRTPGRWKGKGGYERDPYIEWSTERDIFGLLS